MEGALNGHKIPKIIVNCDLTETVISNLVLHSYFQCCGAEADPFWSEPESAPGARTSGAGAAQKSGGSATLLIFASF